MQSEKLQDSAKMTGQLLFVAGLVGDMFDVIVPVKAAIAVGIGLMLIVAGCVKIAR